MDAVRLDEVRLRGYHGVLPQEQKVGNWFLVSLEVRLDLSAAAASDNVVDTIDYAALYRIIEEENAIPSKLLEHFAGRVLLRIGEAFPKVKEADIEITKTAPPFKAHLRGAVVRLSRTYP